MPAALQAAPSLNLDARQTGSPIQPFIYGQFIEHLGRCIYGGIWAEMLEDRKFYFPVTADYAPYVSLKDTPFPVVGSSPWQIVGDASAVTMVKDRALVFVGEHTPRLAAGAAIRQLDLATRAGIDIEGYVWVRSATAQPATLEVAFSWGTAPDQQATVRLPAPSGDYAKLPFRFSPTAATDHASLTVRVTTGDVLIGTVSLMPADHVNGLRRDTLALLRLLDSPIYRWPGGNFVSGYDWRDGIGDRDRRPPRKNPAWTGVEHNDFGTDEFLAFCRTLRTEPMIAVNTGLGDAHSAAQWVEYTNASATEGTGAWRARNGHPAPYAVKYWCVGNEMFGPWQLGFMQLAHYTIKHNEVATAMRGAAPAPDLVLVGVGDLDRINTDHDPDQAKSGHKWSHGMLLASADHMEMISEHFYEGRLPWTKDGRVPLSEHVRLLAKTIRRKAEGHRALQASLPHLKGRIIPIAMDEWNYWHRDYVYGELGCSYDQADALGTAIGLHEFFRQSDIIHMAHYAQTVNVIGAIKTTKTAAEMETTGLVLQLYRARFGQIPLKLAADLAPLDVAAALTTDVKTLTVAIVNPTAATVSVPLALTGLQASGPGTRWLIAAPDEHARNTPGQPRRVDIVETPGLDPAQRLTVPALGIALFSFPVH
jgi:alpha-N-arabinofuranosidase